MDPVWHSQRGHFLDAAGRGVVSILYAAGIILAGIAMLAIGGWRSAGRECPSSPSALQAADHEQPGRNHHRMTPEAIEEAGSLIVLPTVVGFLVALYPVLTESYE
jgi:hypothetical protein